MKKRYRVIYEGQVQGVGFRWLCLQYAQQFGISGSVRNMSNGMVELYVQGEESRIDQMLAMIKQGNRWAQIDDITIQEIAVVPQESSFQPIL